MSDKLELDIVARPSAGRQRKTRKRNNNNNNNTKNRGRKMINRSRKKQQQQQSGSIFTGITRSNTANYTRAPAGIPLQLSGSNNYDQFVVGWLSSLMNPEQNMVRIPDSWGGKTALIRNIVEYEIPAYFNAADLSNNGKWSVMMQPILGNPAKVDQYSLYISAPGNWSVANWNLPTSYQGDNNVSDPRQLKIAARFCSQEPGYYAAGNGTGTSAPQPFGNTVNVASQTYNVSVAYENSVNSNFTIPPGSWNITVVVVGTALAGLTTSPATTVTLGPVAPFITATTCTLVALVTSGGIGANQNIFGVLLTAGTITSAVIFMSPAFSDGVSPNYNAGIFQRIRPVAMSALLTAIQAPINAGGRTNACLVTAKTASTHYFQTAKQYQLQEVDYLSTQPGAMSGDYLSGAYCWWAPEGSLDVASTDINNSNDYDFPNIVMSGIYVPTGAPPTVPIPIYRLRIVNIFEVEVSTSVLELQSCIGSTTAFDTVLNASSVLTHTTFNRSHQAYIRQVMQETSRILRDGKKIYKEHADIIAPLVATLGKLAISFI